MGECIRVYLERTINQNKDKYILFHSRPQEASKKYTIQYKYIFPYRGESLSPSLSGLFPHQKMLGPSGQAENSSGRDYTAGRAGRDYTTGRAERDYTADRS